MGLTHKQQVFVNEYLRDFNATQAAIRTGYSQKSAGAIGNENLLKPEIKQAIEQRIERGDLKTERALRALLD